MLTTNKRVTPLQIKRKPNLKICLLGYRSNPYSGGQGIYIKCLSKALSEAGHSVDVISGEPYPDLDEKVQHSDSVAEKSQDKFAKVRIRRMQFSFSS